MRFTLKVVATAAAFLLTPSSANSAPSGWITGSYCNAVKVGNNVNVTAGGTYNAPQNSKDYLINGFQIRLWNNGGQQLRNTGLVSITPTSAYTAIQSWTIPYKEASSLKNMQFDVFNGGALKASSGLVPCIWK